MKTELFDYVLPEQAIAQRPLKERDGARLFELGQPCVDRKMTDFAELLPEDSLLVLNDTKVRRARLLGQRLPNLGRVEIFLLNPAPGSLTRWSALGRSNKPLRAGDLIQVEGVRLKVLGRTQEGTLEVEFLELSPGEVEATIERIGQVPLPPYMKRPAEHEDGERYQTLFAEFMGSVAAPTAGLHLSEQILKRLRSRGVEVARVTLHVGVGTFRPVTCDDLDAHPMHSERLSVGEETCERVNAAKAEGRPVVAVGTTVVRALESAARLGRLAPFEGETNLLIQPGYSFQIVDALLTNFHMPKSTLLALVSAFAGRERVMDGYQQALAWGYRFLSYGDAMWIPKRR